MGRTMVLACLPWVGLLLAGVAAAAVLLWLSRARPQFSRLLALHREVGGGVQSLSLVITLPVFIWIILFIVQISQATIASLVVNYAAYATARAAVVWIPAYVYGPPEEPENCIGSDPLEVDPEATDNVDQQVLAAPSSYFPAVAGPGVDPNSLTGGTTYLIKINYADGSSNTDDTDKVQKIRAAAALALAAVSPARTLNPKPNAAPEYVLDPSVISDAFKAIATKAKVSDTALQNKLAYAWDKTEIQLRIFHDNTSRHSVPLNAGPNAVDYSGLQNDLDAPKVPSDASFPVPANRRHAGLNTNEIGFQDAIMITIKYPLVLLPGMGILVYQKTENMDFNKVGNDYYTFVLTGKATLPNEGEINGIYDP